jgi:hypothetical protein
MIPKSVKCKDLIGRRVKLVRDMSCFGGEKTLSAGHVLEVSQTHRGRFTLTSGVDSVLHAARKDIEQVVVPECGFIEQPDGTIAWGSAWEPGGYDPEPVAVEYSQLETGAWVPRQAWVKDENGYIDLHDCDWIESREELHHHESGGGDPYINGWSEPEKMPGRLWMADGTKIRSDGWGGPPRVLSDEGLRAIGVKRVHGPTPAPFAYAVEGSTFYDERTKQRVPDDDGETCSCCCDQFVRQEHDLVVLDERELDDDECAGLYRPHEFGWTGSSLHGDWMAPLPPNMDDSWGDPAVCSKCTAQTVSDFSVHGLVVAWCEDAEAMQDEHREALLDAVRERVDRWISGYPERREQQVHGWFAGKELHLRLGIPAAEAIRLCEEAGYRA